MLLTETAQRLDKTPVKYTKHSDSACMPINHDGMIVLYSAEKFIITDTRLLTIGTDVSFIFPRGMCGMIVSTAEFTAVPQIITDGQIISVRIRCSDDLRWGVNPGYPVAAMIMIPWISSLGPASREDHAAMQAYYGPGLGRGPPRRRTDLF